MARILSALYQRAKANIDAVENFTTEALVAAIREDLGPMHRALAGLGVVERDVPRRVLCVPFANVPGVGEPDLVLSFEHAARVATVWVEIKVGSPESGDQLERYQKHLATIDLAARPVLVVLGPRKIHEHLPWLRWHDLWRESAPQLTTGTWWRALREFMEDRKLAAPFDDHIYAREAGSQFDAFALLNKVGTILAPVSTHIASVAPKLHIRPPGHANHRQELARQFATYGNLSIVTHARGARVSLGTYADAACPEAWLGVRVWHARRDVAARQKLVTAADAGELSEAWARSPADDEAASLSIYARLASFESTAGASAWLRARIDELAEAGVLRVVSDLAGSGDVNDDDDDIAATE